MKIKVNILDAKTHRIKVRSPEEDANFVEWVQGGAR